MLQSLFAIWVCHFLMDLIIGVWPIYKILVGLDLAKASLIAGVCMIVGEAFQVLFGAVSSQISTKPLLLLGVFLAGSVGFIAYTESYLILFLIMLLISIGSSAFHPAAAGTIGGWDHHRKSFMITLFYMGGTVGAAISQFAFAAYWHCFEGQTVYFFIPVLAVLVWLLFHRFPKSESQLKVKWSQIRETLAPYKRTLFILFWIQVIMQAMVVNFMFLLPDLMMSYGYPSWMVFGGGDFFFVIGAAALGLVAGYFADLYPYHKILNVSLFASFILTNGFLLSMPLSVPVVAVVLFLVGGALGLTMPMIIAAGMKDVPASMQGLAGGLLMGGATCLAGITLSLTGYISTLFTGDPLLKTLMVLSSLVLVAFVLSLQLNRETQKQPLLEGV